MRACGAVLAAAALAALASEPRPSTAALRKAYEANRAALVEVVGPHARGTGVVVGADGQVLTSTRFVGLEAAELHVADRTLPAKVLMANASLGVAVVAPADGGTERWPSTPVALNFAPARGTWVVGLRRAKNGEISPVLGQVSRVPRESPFIETNLSLPPGSPLFDARGRLVAICVRAHGGGSQALPLPAVKTQLAQEAPP